MSASQDAIDLRQYIRDVPDFPKPGILFKDITPMLLDPKALRHALTLLTEQAAAAKPDLIVGIESRGFVFGAPLADRLGVGFVPVRKPGKLPYKRVRDEYALEYGTGTLELHEDAVGDHRVIIVDDLLATGGTAACSARLCERLGARVAGFLFVVELEFLGGRKALGDRPVTTLVKY
jgi:adenine phosphoribosyltransferase